MLYILKKFLGPLGKRLLGIMTQITKIPLVTHTIENYLMLFIYFLFFPLSPLTFSLTTLCSLLSFSLSHIFPFCISHNSFLLLPFPLTPPLYFSIAHPSPSRTPFPLSLIFSVTTLLPASRASLLTATAAAVEKIVVVCRNRRGSVTRGWSGWEGVITNGRMTRSRKGKIDVTSRWKQFYL